VTKQFWLIGKSTFAAFFVRDTMNEAPYRIAIGQWLGSKKTYSKLMFKESNKEFYQKNVCEKNILWKKFRKFWMMPWRSIYVKSKCKLLSEIRVYIVKWRTKSGGPNFGLTIKIKSWLQILSYSHKTKPMKSCRHLIYTFAYL